MAWRRGIVCEELIENLPPPCGETQSFKSAFRESFDSVRDLRARFASQLSALRAHLRARFASHLIQFGTSQRVSRVN